jgi:tetratricopeptide (TPR) repeat protein
MNNLALKIGLAIAAVVLVIAVVVLAVLRPWRPEPEPVPPGRLYESGLAAAAERDWQTLARREVALRDHPDFNNQRLLLAGLLQLGQGDVDDGLRMLSRCAEHPETRVVAVFNTAIVHYELGDFDETVRLLQVVIGWDPDHEDAHRYLAAAYYDIGAMDNALSVLERVVEIAPDDFRAYRFQGIILQDFEHYEDSELQFRKGLTHVPADSEFAIDMTLSLSQCLVKRREYEEALRLADTIASAQSGLSTERSGDLFAVKAEANLALRRFDAARAAIDAANQTDTNTQLALIAARLAEEEERLADGIAILRSAIANHPGEPRLHTRLADLLAISGDSVQAQQARETAVQLQAALTRFADLHQQAIGKPNDVTLRLQLAEVAEQLHRMDLAEMWLKAATGMAPQDPTVSAAIQAYTRRNREQGQTP